jgi:rhodanese-related sulfurtransferase
MNANILIRAAGIVLFASLMAVAHNAVSPRRIAWVGTWPSTYGTDSAAVPPSYKPDDPAVLRLDEAVGYFQAAGAQFVDARDVEDYKLGHIPGAVNFPFDYYDEHAPTVLPLLDRERDIITYCGGADCELSLYLARQLRNEGFTRIHLFFGGITQWQEAGLPTEVETP